MTGGGLYVLVTYGTQNVILSGNPQMTYYYKIFKRYSHFSMENVTIALQGAAYPTSGVNTVQLRTKIQRVGDLLSDMIFSFDLPDIYSRAVSAALGPSGSNRTYEYKFQWVKAIGAAIINSAEFFIGGQSIQRIDGTYLYAKAQLEYDTAMLEKWNIMVGNTPELTAPQAGAYSGSSSTGPTYPTVITQPQDFTVSFTGLTEADTSILIVTSLNPGGFIFAGLKFEYLGVDGITRYKNTISKVIGNTYYLLTPAIIEEQSISAPFIQQVSRPSIFAQTIHVPLNFWFTDATSQALPLVALQNQECEIVITLNPIRKLYTLLDPEGNRVEPQSETNSNINNNPVYSDTLQVNNFQTFLLDQTATILNINPRVQCTFVYLSDNERTTFATRPLTYILPQLRITSLSSPYEYPVNVVTEKLEMSSTITRFIFVTRRTDWQRRNDFTNFTNWSTYPFAPWDAGALQGARKDNASGIVVANSQRDIIRALRILCNGNEIQELKPYDFLTKIYPFRYTTGNANAEIPIYTWALTSSKIQPSGSINSSRVTNFQVEITFNPLFLGANYGYNVDLYVETLNFLIIASGSGAPKYVL
uniref:Major capsid protein N-terminal domain-containing protein n=1 Tax=viral metagenome TaxID=1070528 RepID=A0A6C0K6P3_9ZZZZ